MRPKTLLVLALVVVFLGAFIWFFEGDLPSSEERAEQAKKVLGGLETSDVGAIEIVWGGSGDEPSHKVRLEKQTTKPPAAESEQGKEEETPPPLPAEERWQLVEPRTARADKSLVGGLLTTLTTLQKLRTVDDADRAAMGLEPPAVTVTLGTEDGQKVLELGSEVPVSKNRIVALAGGSEVFVVRGSVYQDLTRDPGEWRDKRIVGADRDDITRVELAAEGREPVILVKDDEMYRLEAPLHDRADRDEALSFLRQLADLRAQSFVDQPEDPEALELDPPRVVVTAELDPKAGEDGPIRLELGAVLDEKLGRRYGRSGDQVFIFQNQEIAKDLARPAEEWRSKAWSGMQVFRIDAVEVHDAVGDLSIERAGGDWNRGEDRIPYTPVSDLLYAITEAKAEQVVSLDQARDRGWSLEQPTHTLTLRAKDQPDETLTLYPAVDGGVPARAGDREAVLLLPADRLTTLDQALADVRAAEPIPEQPADAAGEDEGTGNDDPEAIDITTDEGS